MSGNLDELLSRLQSPEDPEFESSWDFLIKNRPLWFKLQSASQESLTKAVTAANAWQGSNWTSSSAAKLVYAYTWKALVQQEFQPYKITFLYALHLVWGLDAIMPQCLSLADNLAQVAFELATASPDVGTNVGNSATNDAESHANAPTNVASMALPYDEPTMPMADIYAAVWHRSGSMKFDAVSISSILDDVPVMDPLPKRAPENNHLQDSK